MLTRRRCSIVLACALVVLSMLTVRMSAQVAPERISTGNKSAAKGASREASKTTLEVQLLVGRDGVGQQSQRWLRVFEKLQISLTIRPGDIGEKLSVTEQSLGNGVRRVKLIGGLDRSGRIMFPDRSFTEADADKLAEWLAELREFGAQGAPAGKPVWGLSNDQFERLFRGLATPVRIELQDQPLAEALSAFDLPNEFPLSFSDAAAARIEAASSNSKVHAELKGLAQGTALSALLNQWGLGFRPQRARSGALQLTVVTLTEASDVWPVGWPPTKKAAETAPALFKLLPIELDDIELDAVLESVADVSKVPVLIDHHGLQQLKIDPAEVKVSHPRRQASYNMLLKSITAAARAQHEIRIDEAGRPLVWVFPFRTPSGATSPPVRNRDN
jgi:hypothetical protein